MRNVVSASSTMSVVKWVIFFWAASTVMGDEVLTRAERVTALTILGEARGEGKEGMLAVACVLQRRTWEKSKSPAQICLEPWQFSIWNAGRGRVKKESELYYLWKSPSMMYARELARQLNKNHKEASNCIEDIVNGANHYHNKDASPYWIKGHKPVKIIGNHLFYKLP